MSKHTPGPWHVDQNGAVRGGDLSIVAVRHRLPKEIHELNARLIAAAPEMYEALKEARRLLDQTEIGSSHEVDAAIAKAEGRT